MVHRESIVLGGVGNVERGMVIMWNCTIAGLTRNIGTWTSSWTSLFCKSYFEVLSF
jgi:hypothetical protein